MYTAPGYMTSCTLKPGVKQTWVQIPVLPLTSCRCTLNSPSLISSRLKGGWWWCHFIRVMSQIREHMLSGAKPQAWRGWGHWVLCAWQRERELEREFNGVACPAPHSRQGVTQDKHTVGEKASPLDSVPRHLSRLCLLPKKVWFRMLKGS